MGRLGTVANDGITPGNVISHHLNARNLICSVFAVLAEDHSVPLAAWFGLLMCLCSLSAACMLAVLNRQAPLLKISQLQVGTAKSQCHILVCVQQSDSFDPGMQCPSLCQSLSDFFVSASTDDSSLLLSRSPRSASTNTASSTETDCASSGHAPTPLVANGSDSRSLLSDSEPLINSELPTLAHLKLFPCTLWLTCGIILLLYSTVVPFHSIASDFLQNKFVTQVILLIQSRAVDQMVS